MANKIDEHDIIEKLNGASTVRGFFITTVDIFNDSVDDLIQRVFRKDNFAVQSVVGPLLHDSGPLGNLSVRLKLLFGLGVIADDVYHDIESMMKLRNMLNNDAADYEFTDAAVLNAIMDLNLVRQTGMIQVQPLVKDNDMSEELFELQRARQQQMIRSSLLLVIVEICNELGKDSPL